MFQILVSPKKFLVKKLSGLTAGKILSCLVGHSSVGYCYLRNHKKRKDSLETRAVLTFSLELEISRVAIQVIHQKIKKWLLSARIFLVKMIFGLF